MKKLDGFNISFEFENLIQMSDLIYYDGPLLSHFVSKSGEDYLFYWVDVDETYNRWMFFRTNSTIIQKYLDRKISLRNVILSLDEQYVYFVEVDDDLNFVNSRIVTLPTVPQEYLPSENSFYCFEKHDYDCLDSISRELNSGVLELHIEGKDVGYGSISLGKLCRLLPQVESIRKDLATSFNKKVLASMPKGTKGEEKKERALALKLDTDYEVRYMMAGSARLILKPKSPEVASSLIEDERDLFAFEMLKVLSSGFKEETVKTISEEYGKNIVQKYSDLVEFLNEEQIGIQFTWYNSNININQTSKIERKQVAHVRAVLQTFDLNEDDNVVYDGYFISLNVKTGSFSFETDDKQTITGKLDIVLMEIVNTITFNKRYSIEVNCSKKAHVGGKVKKTYILLGFSEE